MPDLIEPTKVLEANYRCLFNFFHPEDENYEGESKEAFGYCVINAQKNEHHYVSLEDLNSDELLTVYPPCKLIGLTNFILFESRFVECWSLQQFCLASNSVCASIYRPNQFFTQIQSS